MAKKDEEDEQLLSLPQLVLELLSLLLECELGSSGLKTPAKLRGPGDADPVVRRARRGEATFPVTVVVMQMCILL